MAQRLCRCRAERMGHVDSRPTGIPLLEGNHFEANTFATLYAREKDLLMKVVGILKC